MALNQTEIEAIQALLDAGVSQQDREQIEQQLLNEGLVVDSSNQIVPQNVPQPTTPAVPVVGTPQVDLMQSAFALIQQALLSQQGGVSENEVNTIIKKYLTNEKVQKPELSDDLLNFIQQTKKIEVMIPEITMRKTTTIFPQPITDLILSDMLSANNVYLYGGAGTGKTYIAEAIGEEIMNCQVYTLPCNQYTSPLDLIGGQTIEGYQEGIVTRAYGCLDIPDDKDGALLILDELPKLDPNTAGVLNDMLAKVKRGKGITNGRQEIIERPHKFEGDGENRRKVFTKKFFVIATGNILLNREDPAYAGNTKQDLSLQDRFAGSCYEFIIELESEKANFIGMLFLWNYLIELRFEIMNLRYDNYAFVSRRLMESLRDTHFFYMAQKKDTPREGMEKFAAKTVIQGLESFFDLFLPNQAETLKQNTQYQDFKKLAIQKMNMNPDVAYVDSADDIKKADELVKRYMTIQLSKYKYLQPQG
jgi:cobaltochelatase CobS